jgi:hypothetical protein
MNVNVENILKEDEKLQSQITQLEEVIDKSKYFIKELEKQIQENSRKLLTAFGLQEGEKVRYVQHEWFGPLSAYSAPFEQIVVVDRMFIYNNEPCGRIGTMLKKSPKHKKGRNIYWNSYSLYKMSGELILENILKHTRPVEEVTEERKRRLAEMQKI